MNKLEHIVEVTPSRNWIREEPKRNYGITTCWLYFIVRGEQGAVQFAISSMWASKPVREHLAQFDFSSYWDQPREPIAVDLGYHSPTPHYEGQEPTIQPCKYVNGGVCYCDGSALNAKMWVEGFLAGGTYWLWAKLEQYYEYIFNDGKYPNVTPTYLPHPD